MLAEIPAVPANERRIFATRSIGYEEELVISRTILAVDFENSLDAHILIAHRMRIGVERERSGEQGAGALWIDYSQRKRLYPFFWEPFLLGRSDSLPHGPPGQ
jgi:hypothetical protein